MRILVYGFSGEKGGKEEYMMNLNLQSIKNDIYFDYIIEGGNHYYNDRIKEYSGDAYYYTARNLIQKMREIKKIIYRNAKKYDYFYFNTSGLYFIMPIIYAKKCGIKVIVHAHSARDPMLPLHYRIVNYFNRLLVNRIVKIKFACSDLASNWIFGKKGGGILVKNGVDLKKYEFSHDIREKYRKRLGFNPEDIVLVSVGRMSYPKNQKLLIDMMSDLPNDYKLLLVGDGPDYDSLMKLSGGRDNIIFLGNREDTEGILMASDVFLMPSFYEGFPIAAIEAQATGMLCLLSDRITRQARIIEQVKYLSIDNRKEWLEAIIKRPKYERTAAKKVLKRNCFDVKDASSHVIDNLLRAKVA